MAEVSAPASSGNLGPGFDVIGLALELRCTVTAEPASSWSAEHVGPHPLPAGYDDVVLAAAQKMVTEGALKLTVDNEIPLARGLGSSSAATAAGAAVAMLASTGAVDLEAVSALVAEFEGHADNAAATVYGGCIGVAADATPIALEVHPDWSVIVSIPDHPLPTPEARRVLPPAVDRSAVVRNSGRLIALIEGLRTGDGDVLAKAGGDELHQLPRAVLYPEAEDLISAATTAGAAHACWSGAGPSILALVSSERREAVADALARAGGAGATVRALDIARRGLVVA